MGQKTDAFIKKLKEKIKKIIQRLSKFIFNILGLNMFLEPIQEFQKMFNLILTVVKNFETIFASMLNLLNNFTGLTTSMIKKIDVIVELIEKLTDLFPHIPGIGGGLGLNRLIQKNKDLTKD